jgi:hypothetical protein
VVKFDVLRPSYLECLVNPKDPKAVEKWDDILTANPVLKEKGFADKVKKWNALRDAGEAAGLTGDELAQFIAHGMEKKAE